MVVLSACIDPGTQSELDELQNQVTSLENELRDQVLYDVGLNIRLGLLESLFETESPVSASLFGATTDQDEEMMATIRSLEGQLQTLKTCVNYSMGAIVEGVNHSMGALAYNNNLATVTQVYC